MKHEYFNIYDHTPDGRLSGKKLASFAATINDQLETIGATKFIEYGSRYNYHAVDELNADQLRYRKGDKTGRSGIARTYAAGLTAKQCKDEMITFYHRACDEVSR